MILAAVPFLIVGCQSGESTNGPEAKERSIVVIYDNEVHCAIDGYPKMAGFRDAIAQADTAWVATVSAGDYLQGGSIGALSQGQYIVDVMKEMDYDAVTLGNHEFDYKVPRMLDLLSQLPQGTVTCCNLYSADHSKRLFTDYVIKQMGARRVAFVGITTPGAMIGEASAFLAEDGMTLIYDLREDDCVDLVQAAVDKARAQGADYVILLAHLGEVDRGQTAIFTPALLEKTRGIDIVLDGHTHSVIPGQTYLNADGKVVHNMQTGTGFRHVGKLVISTEGDVSTELVPMDDISHVSTKVQDVVNATKEKVEGKLKEVVGENLSPNMNIFNDKGENMPRFMRVPLGTLIAESFRFRTGAQIGFVNGGGVRNALPMGQITYGNVVDVLPYLNDLILISATGQQILDALESATNIYPTASGGFPQCAGLRYEFNPDTKPTLEYDPVTFKLTVHGERRVTKCEVMDDEGNYRPIDPGQTYEVASSSYVIKEGKEVLAFRQSEVLAEGICTDIDAFIDYIANGLHGKIPADFGQ